MQLGRAFATEVKVVQGMRPMEHYIDRSPAISIDATIASTIVQYDSRQPLRQPFLLTCVIFPVGSPGGRGDPAKEKATLQEVLSKLGHASEVPEKYCGGTRITCGNGDTDSRDCVIKISLKGQGLSGQVPRELEKLRALRFLYLNDNPELAGSLHDIQHLTHMRDLYLHRTAITGRLEDLRNMTDLSYLRLDHAAITGKLENLQNMTDLRYLNLDRSAITGKLQKSAEFDEAGDAASAPHCNHRKARGPEGAGVGRL